MASTRVLLIRHADVHNPDRIVYGHLSNGLSPLGRAQAEAVGRNLRERGVARIVHSPLPRAVQTAQLIQSQLPESVPLIPEPDLREAEFGRYLQGVPYWQIPMRRPLWFVHKARRGLLPGDESVVQMGERVLAVVHRVAAAHPDQLSAFVSHADPIQAAWIVLEGRPQNEREMYRKQVDKAGMLEIELDGDRLAGIVYVPPPKVEVPSPLVAD
jgi:2,3-bisphosphoglycerate-dependent phosphoglycerate mutase